MTNQSSIVIAVSGGIAAYKTCGLVRNLHKKNYPVQVIMTPNAERFIGKLSFQALSGRKVYSSEWEEGMLHIDLKNTAGLYAVIPATANCIGKFANGIADDIVSSTFLAVQCPVAIAPSMNPGMYAHPTVQRNLGTLKKDGVHIIDPDHGEAACGDFGQGKMASIEKIEATLVQMASDVSISS